MTNKVGTWAIIDSEERIMSVVCRRDWAEARAKGMYSIDEKYRIAYLAEDVSDKAGYIEELEKEINEYKELYARLGGDDFFVPECTPDALYKHTTWFSERERGCVAYAIAEKLGIATEEMSHSEDCEGLVRQVKEAAERIKSERDEALESLNRLNTQLKNLKDSGAIILDKEESGRRSLEEFEHLLNLLKNPPVPTKGLINALKRAEEVVQFIGKQTKELEKVIDKNSTDINWSDRDNVVIIHKLIGTTLQSAKAEKNELIFVDTSGTKFRFYHDQDCCEGVWIESIDGDLNDLVGSPIYMAEKSCRVCAEEEDVEEYGKWTFYRFATAKGYVTVRWMGESNGWYSVEVGLDITDKKGKNIS
jgi:hypothetical protein